MMKQLLTLCALFNLVFASELKVYDDCSFALIEQSSDCKEIAFLLSEIGVDFEQWEANCPLSKSSTEEEIKKAYQDDILRIMQAEGFQSVDVLRICTDHPKRVELRQKFLSEHTHDEPEVRFFVEGSGLFFLHCEGRVYSVLCEKGDLISIPTNYKHWFDMGSEPCFTAIRFFTRTEGWIAHFTGDPISEKLLHSE